MKPIFLAAALFLTACAHQGTPPNVESAKIPDLPAYYAKKAEKLPPVTDGKMGNVAVELATTSGRYNEEVHRYNNLVNLYNCVKESINNKKVADTCLDK